MLEVVPRKIVTDGSTKPFGGNIGILIAQGDFHTFGNGAARVDDAGAAGEKLEHSIAVLLRKGIQVTTVPDSGKQPQNSSLTYTADYKRFTIKCSKNSTENSKPIKTRQALFLSFNGKKTGDDGAGIPPIPEGHASFIYNHYLS